MLYKTLFYLCFEYKSSFIHYIRYFCAIISRISKFSLVYYIIFFLKINIPEKKLETYRQTFMLCNEAT